MPRSKSKASPKGSSGAAHVNYGNFGINDDVPSSLVPSEGEMAALDAWYRDNPGDSPPNHLLNSCEGNSYCRGLNNYVKSMLSVSETLSYFVGAGGAKAAVKYAAAPKRVRAACLAVGMTVAGCTGEIKSLRKVIEALEKRMVTGEAMQKEASRRAVSATKGGTR